MENIFASIQGQRENVQEAQRTFDKQMKEAVRGLMARKEGRVFLRWLAAGHSAQGAQNILQLIMDYEEEKCLK